MSDFALYQKRNSRGRFESEAEGLRLLRLASRSKSKSKDVESIHVPQVFYAKDNHGIDIERISDLVTGGNGSRSGKRQLARGLRVIHEWQDESASSFPSQRTFGFSLPGQCGELDHPNNEEGRILTWPEFFSQYRLQHQLRTVKTRHPEEHELIGLLTKLDSNLTELFDGQGLLSVDIRPSLLHGDLWNGNWGQDASGRVWIYDPAPFYGHFEFDFGIGKLFGGPTSEHFLEDYFSSQEGGACQRSRGLETRLELYALYHNLNHLNIFGTSYLRGCLRQLRNLTSKSIMGA